MSLTGIYTGAPCADDPVTFDAAADGHPGAITTAKAICAGCPIREACLADALAREKTASRSNRWGIYGGLTARERAKSTGVTTPPDRICGVCGRKIDQPRGRQKYHDGTCRRVASRRNANGAA